MKLADLCGWSWAPPGAYVGGLGLLWVVLGSSMGGLGPLLSPLWAILGRSWDLCGRSWPLLGSMLAVLGRSCSLCWRSGAALGAFDGGPGPSWAEKWPCLAQEQEHDLRVDLAKGMKMYAAGPRNTLHISFLQEMFWMYICNVYRTSAWQQRRSRLGSKT